MKKQVMIRAWEIAREGVKKFGGKVIEYFAMALKLAWKEAKRIAADQTGSIKLMGTDKQIKWAEDIRNDVIEKIEKVADELEVYLADVLRRKPRKAQAMETYKKMIDQLKNETEAGMWIELFGYNRKLYIDVVSGFRRYLQLKGEEKLIQILHKDFNVAEKLDFENLK